MSYEQHQHTSVGVLLETLSSPDEVIDTDLDGEMSALREQADSGDVKSILKYRRMQQERGSMFTGGAKDDLSVITEWTKIAIDYLGIDMPDGATLSVKKENGEFVSSLRKGRTRTSAPATPRSADIKFVDFEENETLGQRLLFVRPFSGGVSRPMTPTVAWMANNFSNCELFDDNAEIPESDLLSIPKSSIYQMIRCAISGIYWGADTYDAVAIVDTLKAGSGVRYLRLLTRCTENCGNVFMLKSFEDGDFFSLYPYAPEGTSEEELHALRGSSFHPNNNCKGKPYMPPM